MMNKEEESLIEKLKQEIRFKYEQINKERININELNKLRIEVLNLRNKLSELQLIGNAKKHF